jgi:PAS domain S-box-containing protein
MLNDIERELIHSSLVLAIPFALFAIVLALLPAEHWVWQGHRHFIEICLFIPAVYAGVWLVMRQCFRRRQRVVDRLQNDLAGEKATLTGLQSQFEENILKRTFELQVANGALNREIAERTQAEEEVRELQKQLHLILDCAGEGILGLDNKGRVIFMNQAASLMLGWEAEELLGKTHHDLIHHTHPDGSPHPVENCPIYMAYRDGIVHYKTGDVFWGKNRTSFPVEYVSTPIKDRGMLTGAVVVFRDMSTYS